MEELSILASPGVAASAAATNTQTAAATAAISSDFETFIRMLTAQIENQDPLNPIESADFATQLATFSGVEQQVQTNELLSSFGGQLGAIGLSQLSGWIGMEAEAEVPVVFDGEPVKLTVEGQGAADYYQLVVRDLADENQRVVATISDFDGARRTISWNGTNEFGQALPSGIYDITVESVVQGDVTRSNPVTVHGLIHEAQNQNGQIQLLMEGGQQLLTSEVLGLRAPEASQL